MIKPLNAPQLSSAKPRSGLNKISELLPRLIRQYEIQAELKRRNEAATADLPVVVAPVVDGTTQQSTFSWYE